MERFTQSRKRRVFRLHQSFVNRTPAPSCCDSRSPNKAILFLSSSFQRPQWLICGETNIGSLDRFPFPFCICIRLLRVRFYEFWSSQIKAKLRFLQKGEGKEMLTEIFEEKFHYQGKSQDTALKTWSFRSNRWSLMVFFTTIKGVDSFLIRV